jgi:hypothetical protein
MGEDRPAPSRPQAPVLDDWEASIEAAIAALRREFDWFKREHLKVAGQVAQLMRERVERAKHGARR